MTTSLDEWRKIALASLGLPDERLLDVLKLVHKAPDRDHVREVLDRIRPRLVRLRPPRPLTSQRLLFRPVEDLFDPAERYRAKIGRLSRLIIHPCWTVTEALLEPTLLRHVDQKLREINSLDANEVYAVGLPLWQAAGRLLTDFIAADTSIGRRQVGKVQVTITEDVRQQIADIADMLMVAPEIETVKIHLPERPISSLAPVEMEMLTQILNRLAAESTRKVQTFVMALLARMARPGDLLQVLGEISLPCSTNERAGVLKSLGTTALATLTFEAQDLRKHQSKSSDLVEGAKVAEQMVSRLASLERSLSNVKDRNVSEQVQTARKEIGTYVLDTVVAKADQTLFQHLTVKTEPGVANSRTEPTVEQVENAEQCALSLRRCARVADAVGVRKEVDRKLSSICTELERQGTAPEADESAQSRRLIRSVRLIEMIAGPDEAQRILMAQFAKQTPRK